MAGLNSRLYGANEIAAGWGYGLYIATEMDQTGASILFTYKYTPNTVAIISDPHNIASYFTIVKDQYGQLMTVTCNYKFILARII